MNKDAVYHYAILSLRARKVAKGLCQKYKRTEVFPMVNERVRNSSYNESYVFWCMVEDMVRCFNAGWAQRNMEVRKNS